MRLTTSRWHRTESCEPGLQSYQDASGPAVDDALECVDGIVTQIGDDKILLGERVDGTADGTFTRRCTLGWTLVVDQLTPLHVYVFGGSSQEIGYRIRDGVESCLHSCTRASLLPH